jgi:polysaccharide deacetylase family protein (PEP-CTERM system associated)
MLSFDVEEYFQVEAAAEAGMRRQDWQGLQHRLEPCVSGILRMLEEHRVRATFFVLGWVARHEPAVVAAIVSAGHEIASHGMNHQILTQMAPAEFQQDLLESRKILEDIAGKQVVGYRAPTFSIMHKNAWALDVLADNGFLYDSSVFPIRHDRYGVPDAPACCHIAQGPGGGRILEIPPVTRRVWGINMPLGGGGYFRLLPLCLVRGALRKLDRTGQAGMIYLHPWEFDPDQPVLAMSRLSRFRHRVGLAETEKKLRRLMAEFQFGDVRSRIDDLMSSAPVYQYGLACASGD